MWTSDSSKIVGQRAVASRGGQIYSATFDQFEPADDSVRHWLWRAVDEHGFVQGILLQRHRDTEAAKTFLTHLLAEYDVSEVIHTDQLLSYGAAIRELPSLINVDY